MEFIRLPYANHPYRWLFCLFSSSTSLSCMPSKLPDSRNRRLPNPSVFSSNYTFPSSFTILDHIIHCGPSIILLKMIIEMNTIDRIFACKVVTILFKSGLSSFVIELLNLACLRGRNRVAVVLSLYTNHRQMLDFYCWLDFRSLPLDFLSGCQIVQDYVKYHDPLWYLSWDCPCLSLVVTNLNFCSSNATRASDPQKSRFRPFSEFIDRYRIGEQIAQYAI